jgi:hypothetical protein
MIRFAFIPALVLVFLLGGCASNEQTSYEESWEGTYNHSFEFLWEEALKSVDYGFGVAERNLDSKTIVSDWDTQLAYFSGQGTRTRITIEFEEVEETRWRLTVSEEKQVNTEQINPTASTEAEWEPADSDGAAASKFRLNFERRINPPEHWRDDALPPGEAKESDDSLDG